MSEDVKDPSNESEEPDPQADSALTSTVDLKPQEISDEEDEVESEPVANATSITRTPGHYSL